MLLPYSSALGQLETLEKEAIMPPKINAVWEESRMHGKFSSPYSLSVSIMGRANSTTILFTH